MYVAFASQDGTAIDAHFAAAKSFSIYHITEEETSLVRHISFYPPEHGDSGDDILSQHDEGEDDKVKLRIEALKDCAIIYCTHIGGPAAARLVQSRIHPLKVPAGTPIAQEVARLEIMLKNNPPPWLRKVRQ